MRTNEAMPWWLFALLPFRPVTEGGKVACHFPKTDKNKYAERTSTHPVQKYPPSQQGQDTGSLHNFNGQKSRKECWNGNNSWKRSGMADAKKGTKTDETGVVVEDWKRVLGTYIHTYVIIMMSLLFVVVFMT